MKLKGKLSISRVTSNEKPYESVRLEIVDESSRIRFLEVNMDLETYGRVISGLSYQDIEYELCHADTIGKKHETKVVTLELGRGHPEVDQKKFAALLKKLAKPHEVDGWEVSDYDLQYNGHRLKNEGNRYSYTIHLHRYV